MRHARSARPERGVTRTLFLSQRAAPGRSGAARHHRRRGRRRIGERGGELLPGRDLDSAASGCDQQILALLFDRHRELELIGGPASARRSEAALQPECQLGTGQNCAGTSFFNPLAPGVVFLIGARRFFFCSKLSK